MAPRSIKQRAQRSGGSVTMCDSEIYKNNLVIRNTVDVTGGYTTTLYNL
jgi:hypothetical protein